MPSGTSQETAIEIADSPTPTEVECIEVPSREPSPKRRRVEVVDLDEVAEQEEQLEKSFWPISALKLMSEWLVLIGNKYADSEFEGDRMLTTEGKKYLRLHFIRHAVDMEIHSMDNERIELNMRRLQEYYKTYRALQQSECADFDRGHGCFKLKKGYEQDLLDENIDLSLIRMEDFKTHNVKFLFDLLYYFR